MLMILTIMMGAIIKWIAIILLFVRTSPDTGVAPDPSAALTQTKEGQAKPHQTQKRFALKLFW